ncbi:Peptide-N4-(N-acetyl-beta-glucosaminyl)asparagineamidase A [Linum perenne]
MAPHSSSSASTLIFFIFLLSPLFSTANLHRFKPDSITIPTSQSPTLFFEVTKPISLPHTNPCVHHLLTHDFAYTLNKPPVLVNYTPPSHCPYPPHGFSKIILEWNATCKGRQFDRIFGIWLSGIELLRSCTAEPRPNGILWSVRKDITKYASLLLRKQSQDLAIFLGNIVDSTYTGIYHVNVSMYFYPAPEEVRVNAAADLILPISRYSSRLSLNDGLWYQVSNSTQLVSNEVTVPSNVYRAVLEVYISPHGDDEFWYTNYPNDYIIANNVSRKTPGNGPFREVVVSLDGDVIGAIWPFTVVYTGGINNLFWRPISAIGSFDLPTYDIEITPFLGALLDSKVHNIGFSVTNALDVWFVDANLHLWLDNQSDKTEAKLVKHDSDLSIDAHSNFKGLNGKFTTEAKRFVYSNGWVKSSRGNITTRFTQRLSYRNSMELRNDGDIQKVNQVISTYNTASLKPMTSYSRDVSYKSKSDFKVELYNDSKEQDNNTVSYVTDVTLGFSRRKSSGRVGNRRMKSGVKNVQKAKGEMVVVNDNLVIGGVGSTNQWYKYRGGDGSCYFRDIKSRNYTILDDKEGNKCNWLTKLTL